MKTLSSVQCGIKALENVLNRMVSGINARTVIAGSGLTGRESGDGIVISLASKTDDQGQTNTTSGAGSGGIPVQIMAFDLAGNPLVLNVLTPDGATSSSAVLKWDQLSVVDPGSCAQSDVTLLSKTGG